LRNIDASVIKHHLETIRTFILTLYVVMQTLCESMKARRYWRSSSTRFGEIFQQ